MLASGCSAGNEELTENDSRDFTLSGCSMEESRMPFVGSTLAGMVAVVDGVSQQ